ncbi:MAG: hypothetical protein H0V66_04540 [Bdellovibrionales bacterium]|nr:hypothetical protein [Bdellovibrionales bacterium]
MPVIFLLLFSTTIFASLCGPHEIYVREQWIESYKKTDGTKVSAHLRKAHCRELTRFNYYQDSTTQIFKKIKTNIKKWKPEEKKIVDEYLAKLPEWMKKYKLSEQLRGDVGGNTNNPAAGIPLTKTLIIFDKFFEASNKLEVLIHEVGHLTILDLTNEEMIGFANASGWMINQEKGIKTPPKILVLPDSSESVSEDYANHIEMYYSDPTNLKKINPTSFIYIEKIIRKREQK